MEPERRYIYKPLDEPSKSTRLIRILSINPILCEIRTIPLQDKPVFSALSYMWGDASIKKPIDINGGSVQVTTNLVHVLRDVYHHLSTNGSVLAHQWLWVDAICINQLDVSEKSFQVPLMEKIYASAQQIFSWLGKENEATVAGFRATIALSKEIEKVPCYDFIHEWTGRGLCPPENVMRDRGLGEEDLRSGWLESHYESRHGSEVIITSFQPYFELLKSPYWKRLWILQELVLAKDIILLCGRHNLSWITVCNVMAWIMLYRIASLPVRRPEAMPYQEWRTLLDHPISQPFLLIVDTKTTRANNNLNTDRTVTGDVGHQELIQLGHGVKTAHAAIEYYATNSKDYVYGMAGVTGIRLPTDYSSNTTVAQVYQKFVAHWLETLAISGEVVLSLPEPPCQLWFLVLAGLGFNWKAIPELPSWAPNFPGIAETPGGGRMCHRLRYKGSGCDVFRNDGYIPEVKNSTIRCMAALVEQICYCVPIFNSMTVTARYDDHTLWLLWTFDLVAEKTTSAADTLDALNYVTHVICSNIEGCNVESTDITVWLLISELEYVCEQERSMPRDVFLKHLHLELPAISTSDLHLSSLPPSRMVRQIEVVFGGIFGVGGTINPDSFGRHLRAFQKALAHNRGLCMSLTDSGRLGIFPPRVQCGDHVGFIKGFTGPVVLRDREGGGYDFIGACCIPDPSEREAIHMLPADTVVFKEVRIH